MFGKLTGRCEGLGGKNEDVRHGHREGRRRRHIPFQTERAHSARVGSMIDFCE